MIYVSNFLPKKVFILETHYYLALNKLLSTLCDLKW